jgi:hypothetical protein
MDCLRNRLANAEHQIRRCRNSGQVDVEHGHRTGRARAESRYECRGIVLGNVLQSGIKG